MNLPLAGESYRWFVGQHEENPGKSSRWDGAREALWHLLELVAADYETHEIDMEAPEVREEIHPKLTEEAKTAQFLGEQRQGADAGGNGTVPRCGASGISRSC